MMNYNFISIHVHDWVCELVCMDDVDDHNIYNNDKILFIS